MGASFSMPKITCIKLEKVLLTKLNGTFIFLQGLVAGIVSGGTGDCNIDEQWPNVYTDVMYFRNWIKATMNDLEDK